MLIITAMHLLFALPAEEIKGLTMKCPGQPENLIQKQSASMLRRTILIYTHEIIDNCCTSPYIKSHFITHPMCQKRWNNITSR